MGKPSTSVVWAYCERLERDGIKYTRCSAPGCGLKLAGHSASNVKRHLLKARGIDRYSADRARNLVNPTKLQRLRYELRELEENVLLTTSESRLIPLAAVVNRAMHR